MDTAPLRDAYRALLEAADLMAEQGGNAVVPQDGGWDADRILAHIALVDAATIATASTVASGAATTYDNRLSHDAWTARRVTALAGGGAGLRERIRRQGEALCALGAALSDAELDINVPTLLLSHDEAVVDQPVPLHAILTGLAEDHLPKHTAQLLALLPTGTRVAVTS